MLDEIGVRFGQHLRGGVLETGTSVVLPPAFLEELSSMQITPLVTRLIIR